MLVSLPFRLFESVDAVRNLGIVDLSSVRELLEPFMAKAGRGLLAIEMPIPWPLLTAALVCVMPGG